MAERSIFMACDQRPILEKLVAEIESEYQKFERSVVTAEEALGYIFEKANLRLNESGARPIHVLVE